MIKMIKSKIPVPATKCVVTSIPRPIKANGFEAEKEINSVIKQSSNCQTQQPKAVVPSLKHVSNSRNTKTITKSLSSSKPKVLISNKSDLNSKKLEVQKKAQLPLVQKPVKKPMKSMAVNINNRLPPSKPKILVFNKCNSSKKEHEGLKKTRQPLTHKPVKETIKPAAVKINNRKTASQSISNLKSKSQQTKVTIATSVPDSTVKSQKMEQSSSDVMSKTMSNVPKKVTVPKSTIEVKITKPSCSEEENADNVNKQQKFESNSGVSDSEFAASDYFKTLILSERELSPNIMKMCSPSKANFKTPAAMILSQYKTVDDFVEDVRRNSSKFFQRKGRLFFTPEKGNQTPAEKHWSKYKSADNFLEDVRRNSARLTRNGNAIYSPALMRQNYLKYAKFGHRSLKENLDSKLIDGFEILDQKLAEIKKQTASKTNSQLSSLNPAERRWTCNVPSKMNIGHINSSQILAEIRRFSGRQCARKQPIKDSVIMSQNNYEFLNPHQRVLRELEDLRLKRKEKLKKKVTFLIPGSNSPESELVIGDDNNVKAQSKLSDIAESGSQTSTPEFDSNLIRSKSYCKDSQENGEESTPEFNLCTYKTNISTDITETAQLDCLLPSKPYLASVNVEELLPSKSSPSSKNVASNNCIQSLERLSISSCSETTKEIKRFCVTDQKLFTPHPVSKYNKSELSCSISPSFLSGKPSTLNSLAPICTPFVLRNLSNSLERTSIQTENSSPVRQKLDFDEKLKLSDERRESQIVIRNIPTLGKMLDCLCDEECCILSSLSPSPHIDSPRFVNPIASILNNGDEMHFVPLSSS